MVIPFHIFDFSQLPKEEEEEHESSRKQIEILFTRLGS